MRYSLQLSLSLSLSSARNLIRHCGIQDFFPHLGSAAYKISSSRRARHTLYISLYEAIQRDSRKVIMAYRTGSRKAACVMLQFLSRRLIIALLMGQRELAFSIFPPSASPLFLLLLSFSSRAREPSLLASLSPLVF